MRRAYAFAVLAIVTAGTALPAFASPATGGTFTVRVTALSPLVALIAGILILLVPRLLNFIVAVYLIVVGLLGLMAR